MAHGWYPQALRNPAPLDCFWQENVLPKLAVCVHRMQGYAAYLRQFQHLAEDPPRRISAHFTIDSRGFVQQHVDVAFASWCQGVPERLYDSVSWPLFAGRNPNYDVVSIELEDMGRAFTIAHPLPDVQHGALEDLITWLFQNEHIRDEPKLGETIIGHHQINPQDRSYCPGEFVWRATLPRVEMAVRTACGLPE